MILVLCVVAVFHVAAEELAEPDREVDAMGAVFQAPDPVDVLASPLLPFRGIDATTLQDLTLLEVDVDWVAPATTSREVPYLQARWGRAKLGTYPTPSQEGIGVGITLT